MSQYYFVLQSLHTALPSTTSYYKACTKHVPVLLCTTRLAQSTSQYYFVLQGLHKVFPSTTLYYKACTKHVPVLLCSTKLAKSTSQYFFCTTSSTAQGGGGSFKNRKPIGEIGCCESGMAERSHWWTERCLISLTLSLSFSDYLPTYQPIFYVSIDLSIYLSTYLPTYLPIGFLFLKLPQCLNIRTSKTEQFCEASSFLNLTTSETKQFCETSSLFEVQDIKNGEFCETSFRDGKLSAELTGLCRCVLRFFQSTCPKYRACHGKLMPGHTKCCTRHAKSS